MATFVEWMNGLMTRHLGLRAGLADTIDGIVVFIGIVLAAVLINWLCQKLAGWLINRSRNRLARSKWGSTLLKQNLARNLLLLIPGIVLYILIGAAFGEEGTATSIMRRLDVVFLIIVAIMIFNSALLSVLEIFINSGRRRNVPLQGLVQALQVIMYFVGAIIIIAVLLDRSLGAMFAGLGASAAVLMLVFKDSILGFVAGVQLSQNKMIRIGDWIQLPDGSANGTVEEITLNTVKVRNWDNTITMIPPYTLVSAPFKNWRGMQESGGRRADKMIYIDLNSLEVCSEEMTDDIVKSFPIMKDLQMEPQMTNIQIYRTYIETYLRQHPDVNTSLDIIVTQKEATAYGLPIEVYFFTKEKAWAEYERRQSNIFDHLMTIVPEFGLRLYQRP